MSQATATNTVVVENDAAQRTQAMLAHLLGIFGILGTGIYYLIKKDDARTGSFVKEQIKESFNFQLLMLCVFVVCSVVVGVLAVVSTIVGTIASFALYVVMLAQLVLVIQGAMKANKGQPVTYPAKIRVLK
jgi:uncharacterized Tic20 family protein